jgi:RNA polymerase sigma-70 factor, ECF subfamily
MRKVKTFERFYTEYRERLFGYLLRKTANYQLAADILQESFTRYLERYRDRGANPGLLFTIGRNIFYDLARKNRVEREHQEQGVRSEPDEESLYLVKEEYRRILLALQTLSEEERDLLALASGGDLSYREIAEISGQSESNIKVRIHRCRCKLKKQLAGEKV